MKPENTFSHMKPAAREASVKAALESGRYRVGDRVIGSATHYRDFASVDENAEPPEPRPFSGVIRWVSAYTSPALVVDSDEPDGWSPVLHAMEVMSLGLAPRSEANDERDRQSRTVHYCAQRLEDALTTLDQLRSAASHRELRSLRDDVRNAKRALRLALRGKPVPPY